MGLNKQELKEAVRDFLDDNAFLLAQKFEDYYSAVNWKWMFETGVTDIEERCPLVPEIEEVIRERMWEAFEQATKEKNIKNSTLLPSCGIWCGIEVRKEIIDIYIRFVDEEFTTLI